MSKAPLRIQGRAAAHRAKATGDHLFDADLLSESADCLTATLDALKLFEKQWSACGSNSDFGRYFSNVRDAVRAAIAKAEGQS